MGPWRATTRQSPERRVGASQVRAIIWSERRGCQRRIGALARDGRIPLLGVDAGAEPGDPVA
ncbi:MAG: hypothetical protein A2X23_11900 [Chloroflexi bacterium GWC2_73_18]|nr:MAG: hypothetical protein A2X23_11900 [Chloroflexi bacterium GWC2_73_18]